MPQGFQITGRVESAARRIVFNVRGEIDSQVMVDRCIEIYASIDAPWTYDRVFDYRRSNGTVEFADVTRLAKWWAGHIDPNAPRMRVALIVNNPLDLVRARAVSTQFPNDDLQTFLSLDEALTWLDEGRA
jgi:hypothetical protein